MKTTVPMRAFACLVLVALAGCSTPPLKLTAIPASAVNLGGSWVLNRDLSEDPVGKITLVLGEQMMGHMSGGMRGKGAGMSGGGGGKRAEKMSQGREKIEGLAQQISGRMSFPERMTIAQHASNLTLTAGGKTRTIPVGVDATLGAGAFHSGWLGDEFVLVLQKDANTRVVQRYSLSPDGSLNVLSEITLKKMHDPITIQRVFVRAKAAG